MPLSTEVRTAGGELLSRADNTWHLQDWQGDARTPTAPYQPLLARSRETQYKTVTDTAHGDGLQVSETVLQVVQTDNTYDHDGNVTRLTVTTTAGSERFVKDTVNELIGVKN